MEYRKQTMYVNISGYANVDYLIPDLCPNCGRSNNPQTQVNGSRKYQNGVVIFFSHTCTSCKKDHLSLQFINSVGTDPILWALYPQNGLTKFSDNINNLSPRFVDLYHQAEFCENNDHFDLAGMGYRAAEEVLIKDFAAKYSDESKEKIAQMSLNSSIAHFYKNDSTSLISSDVVRINGNDFTHWDRPKEFDLKKNLIELKQYMKIFITSIDYKLMIINPPVSRNSHSSKSNK